MGPEGMLGVALTVSVRYFSPEGSSPFLAIFVCAALDFHRSYCWYLSIRNIQCQLFGCALRM